LPGATNTVPCSAAGMFHSRPWNTSVRAFADRATTMSGFVLSTENFWWAGPPWSVMTIQSRPYCAERATCSETRHWASGLYWVWMW